MRKLLPYLIYTNTGDPLANTVLIIDREGKILALDSEANHDPASIQNLNGIITPGFVNAHCHLELSHMKGKVDTGTGLVKFIESVVSQRDADQDMVDDAIQNADLEMYRQGIVAVGDICNRADTFARKDESPIFYYSFVEMFDFWQDQLAAKFFEDYKRVYDQAKRSEGHEKSVVPHAPYTVSKTLFRLINQVNTGLRSISIHNQETVAENEMFSNKEGEFLRLFRQLGFTYDHFQATGKSSVHYAIQQLNPAHRHLFVHNTLTQGEEIETVTRWCEQSYWVSCPNANLYIENRLPDYRSFMDRQAKLCLGTDSLTSNWQLSILEEIKTILRYQSFVPQSAIIRWATLNGAQALGVDDRYGVIVTGKSPGLNLISTDPTGAIKQNSLVQKIS
jgi:cytosine/adenosine deaminase-related metal-dependent hydrolase